MFTNKAIIDSFAHNRAERDGRSIHMLECQDRDYSACCHDNMIILYECTDSSDKYYDKERASADRNC